MSVSMKTDGSNHVQFVNGDNNVLLEYNGHYLNLHTPSGSGTTRVVFVKGTSADYRAKIENVATGTSPYSQFTLTDGSTFYPSLVINHTTDKLLLNGSELFTVSGYDNLY